MPLAPGHRLGPYEILSSLGAGGMGEVYEARDTRLGRTVAIKVLPEALAADAAARARFEREARAVSRLAHPNVCTLHDVGEEEGVHFLVMEHCQGETLAERLERGRPATDEALQIAVQIARALEAAHRKGVVHRDLKPHNVMITPEGRAKLLDFGLAKSLQAADEDPGSEGETATQVLTQTGMVLGTPSYLSPEQARGDETDELTDVWAFGCLLYEMLTGGRAFGAKTPSGALVAVLMRDPRWDDLPDDLPDRVRHLLRRSLRKDPKRRLQHIGDARIEIEEVLEQGSVESSSPPEATPPGTDDGAGGDPVGTVPGAAVGGRRRSMARSAVLVLAASVALAAAAAGTWLALRVDTGVELADRSIAVLPFETLGQETTTPFTEGIHGDILTRLSKISELSVTSRTSVLRFRDPQRPLPAIARELGVAWILRGEVQEVGDRVQVNARLVDAAEDRQVWADSYRRELTAENLFDIQEEITEEIAAQLHARLTPEERRAVGRAPTGDLEAYRLYIRGVGQLEEWTGDDMRSAVEYFQRAIELDPDYALAWAGLSDALSLLEVYGFSLPPGAPTPAEAARRAVELGPEVPEARLSHAIRLLLSQSPPRDAPRALRELERAVELRPSFGSAYIWIAWVHLLVGNPDRALEPAERAVELDPLAPAARVFLAEAYLANGEREAALREAVRGREIQPEKPLSHLMEALALHHLGRFEEAEDVLETALSLTPPEGQAPTRSLLRAVLAASTAAAGRIDRARELSSLIDPVADPFSAGLAHAALAEEDDALEAFSRIQDWDQFSTIFLRYFFPDALGPLRDTPRYEQLLRRADRSWSV